MNRGKIVIPGGSGFLGKILSHYLSRQGFEVVILTRRKISLPYRQCIWDGETLGPWKDELNGALAVINLAGQSVNCRYTINNKIQLTDSRIKTTELIGRAIGLAEVKPSVWINSSTATIYEHTYGPPHTEFSTRLCGNIEAKDDFSVALARAWEEAFNKIEISETRKVIIRTAIVFSREAGTAYEIIRRLVRAGLGGKMGHGKQFVSWIHERDFCRAVEFLIKNQSAGGIYNLAAPAPLRNEEMMSCVRAGLRMPFGIPATRFMLEIGAFFLRTETELIIKSRNVVSERLPKEGFKFDTVTFKECLNKLERCTAS